MIIASAVGIPISRLLTVGSTPIQHSVLNVKALVGAFNQEKTLVWAFPVIIKLRISSNDHHLGMAPGQVTISPVRLILGHQLGGSEAERNDSFE